MLDVSLRAMSDFKSAWLLPIYGMLLMSGLAFLWSVSVHTHTDSRGLRAEHWPATGQSERLASDWFLISWRAGV